MNIPITKPVFGPEELAAIQKPLESGWVVQGPYVQQFEQLFAAFVNAPQAVATSSCTTALHAAVVSLGLKPGDEVIVPAFTWVATPNVVEYQGARPVFCDVELQTFNIDVEQIESHITSRTVGILPVHLFGLCADMNRILQIAKRHGLWVVEDAACGFGGTYHGRHAGTMSDAGCFSFHPRKSITTGEGGMMTTASETLAATARSLRDHGATRSDRERHLAAAAYLLPDFNQVGFNYRMTDFQGALGCAQMERAPWILQRRTELAGRYDNLLRPFTWLQLPTVPVGYGHGYQAYVCRFCPEAPTLASLPRIYERRNSIMDQMESLGVATRQGTHAPVTTGFYRDRYQISPEQFPNAVIAEQSSLALPLYPQMTEAEQDFVVQACADAFQQSQLCAASSVS